MSGHLLVSVSSIFDGTRKDVAKLVSRLNYEGIPVSLLVAPHIDGNWHLAKDKSTRQWPSEQQESGRTLILNGFDQAVQGRRSEFAHLEAHEASLRLKGATRQMESIGFDLDIFAPPRWHLSDGTLEVLPDFGFTVAASTKGLYNLSTGEFLAARNLSVGEGYGAAKWWRRNIIRAAERGAAKGNSVRLSVSGRNLADKKVARDFVAAALAAADTGAIPSDYQLLHR
jgi:predicted deacetylase